MNQNNLEHRKDFRNRILLNSNTDFRQIFAVK